VDAPGDICRESDADWHSMLLEALYCLLRLFAERLPQQARDVVAGIHYYLVFLVIACCGISVPRSTNMERHVEQVHQLGMYRQGSPNSTKDKIRIWADSSA
jgi:hypothetical protein